MFSIEGAELEISRDRPSSVKQGHENGEKKKNNKKMFQKFPRHELSKRCRGADVYYIA